MNCDHWQAPQQADGTLGVKEMCEIPSALVGSSSEDQVLDGKQEACLTDGVVDQTITNNMDISQDNTEEVTDPANVQEISGFTGVDIIALQNSANAQVSVLNWVQLHVYTDYWKQIILFYCGRL